MKQIPEKIFSYLKNVNIYFYLYISFLFTTAAYYFFTYPITAGDTDLWYHLTGGRYFFEHKSIPSNSFFSFLYPPKEGIDYFWLFQALVYKIYAVSSYHGLIIFRAIVFLSLITVILRFFLKEEKNYPRRFYFIFVFVFYMMMMTPRYQLVRPHILSYLFTALFIYLLEYRSKKVIYLLPLLAILWCNLHSITYPLIILICLSYVIEFFVNHIKNRTPLKKEDYHFIIPVIISMGAVFLTPHNVKLLTVPFITTEYASRYVAELQHLKLFDLTAFNIFKFTPSHQTIFNILFITVILAAATSFINRKIRISHMLMFAGGIFLLTKHIRLEYDFVLLSMPLLKTNVLVPADYLDKKPFKPIKIFFTCALAIVLIIMPVNYLNRLFPGQSKYPLSYHNLPIGIVKFLNHVNVGGRILNEPNSGGYVEWMLYPKYTIAIDMQVTHLFTHEDFYLVTNAFFDEEVLDKFVSWYDPSFITVDVNNKKFKELVEKYSEYKLIFFDDSEILYVDKKQFPGIAKEYELKEIDPFKIADIDIYQLNKQEIQSLLKELQVLFEIYNEGSFVNQLMAMIFIKKGVYKKAIQHADLIIETFPGHSKGYRIKGDALVKQNLFEDALSYYMIALKKSEDKEKSKIYKKISTSYSNLKQYKKAYYALNKAINIFSPETSYKDLYKLGLFARSLNKHQEAFMLFMFSFVKSPEEDKKFRELLKKSLLKYKAVNINK